MDVVLRRPGRYVVWGVVAAIAVLALAACGGGMSNGGVKGASKTMTGSHQVTAVETEYKIVLSQSSFAPGTYTFVAMNKGHLAHSLEIDGPGVTDRRIGGTIPPGSSKDLTVTLQKGSYEVYCPVDSHKQLGMLDTIKVGGGAAASTGSTTKSGSSWG